MQEVFFDTSTESAYSAQKMQKVSLYQSPRIFCDLYCLEPGQAQKEHEHAENDKVYHVLSGICTVRIGNETRTLSLGQMAIAPAGVVHGVRNDSTQRATLLVVMAPHPDFRC